MAASHRFATDEVRVFKFEGFELEPGRRVLRHAGKDLIVTPRAFDLLVVLVERAGRLVSKNELLDLVWPKLVVEENNLQVQISALRKLLGAQAIATIPGRGYKFTLLPGETQQATMREPALEAPRVATGIPLALSNLPAHMPALFGRSDDIAALTRLLERHRVVSVVGPAGIGKTRVAQAVAYALRGSYADGVWLVELAPLTNPSLVVPTVARVLGHTAAPKEGALASLLDAIKYQRLLLVLDNCEHLLGAVAQLAAQIVACAPTARLLITSQEPLHVPEECVDRLNALAVPAIGDAASALNYGAVELFVERAQAADPRFVLGTDNVGDVIDLCARLDGIALAIELAAARVSLLGVHGLRQRLDERLKLLSGGARTALPRHQTLLAALQWSYALLSPAEQTVFDRLGVFVGSFSLEAAQHATSDEAIDAWAVLDHLASLVDKSLVLVEEGEVPRYRLLESSRAFALERLAASGALETMRHRHAQSIADTLTGNDPFEGPNARMLRIAPDLDNVRAAATWATGPTGDHQVAIETAAATDMLWDAQGCNDEGARLYHTVERWVDQSTPLRLAARFLFTASRSRMQIGAQKQAEAGIRAASLFRSLGDQFWVFRALVSASSSYSYMGDLVAARRALADAEEVFDPAWPTWLRASIESCQGQFEFFCDRPAEARRHLTAAVDLSRGVGGDDYYAEDSERTLIAIDLMESEFAEALRRSNDLLDRWRTGIGRRAYAVVWRAAALIGLGRLDEAGAALGAVIPQITRVLGSARLAAYHVADLLARLGRLEDAARVIGYIDRLREQPIGEPIYWRQIVDDVIAATTAAFGEDVVARLRSEGRGLNELALLELAFPDYKR